MALNENKSMTNNNPKPSSQDWESEFDDKFLDGNGATNTGSGGGGVGGEVGGGVGGQDFR